MLHDFFWYTRRGFTLVEVLVSVAVFSLLIVGLIGIITAATQLFIDSREHVVAISLATERLEFIQSLLYDDVGFLNPSSGEPVGVLPWRTKTITRDNQDYTVITAIEDLVSYREVTVTVTWTSYSGVTRDVSLVTHRVLQSMPFTCGECPTDWSCEPTFGVCLPTVPQTELVYGVECVPGSSCPDGSLCPVNAVCAGIIPPPKSAGASCSPGQLCNNGSLCSLEGICETETCPTGLCGGAGICFQGYCYDPWFELSFPANDGSGPSFNAPLSCAQDICDTSADCPAPCDAGGVQIAWQCENTWVPMCAYATAYGSGPVSISREDGGLTCQPVACPASGVCVNGVNCGTTSSNRICAQSTDCPLSEECSSGRCRSWCPDGNNISCGIFAGGYTKGCRPYPIMGGVASLNACSF